MDVNVAVLVGRLTREPDLRYTPSGVAVASFTIAVNRPYKNADQTRDADFINCVAWRGAAETIANYFKKGDEIGITGRIQTRSYENNERRRVYVTEIVVDNFSFGQKAGGSGSGNGNTPRNGRNANTGRYGAYNNIYGPPDDDPFANEGEPINIRDEDLPF